MDGDFLKFLRHCAFVMWICSAWDVVHRHDWSFLHQILSAIFDLWMAWLFFPKRRAAAQQPTGNAGTESK